MRPITRLCVLIYALTISLSALAQELEPDSASNPLLDVDRYKDFWRQGVLDVTVSNQAANEIVLSGITSDNAEIVNWTIKAMSNLAATVINGLPNPYGPIPSRSFSEVSGLKEFLMEHWMKQHEASGYDNGKVLLQTLKLKSDSGLDDLPPDILWEKLSERMVGWPSIPQILCSFWPEDADVHELLWYYQAKDLGTNHDDTTLRLLNTGKFTTPEADAFRISHLTGPNDFDTYIAVGMAAEGLAMNHPIDALPRLIDAGKEHPLAKESVLVALSGYADDQLAQYAGEIQSLLDSGKPLYPTDAVSTAYNRLEMFTKTHLTAH